MLVSGCHPGDCHYISGNLVARRKFALLKNFLGYLGIDPGRVQFSWVSASEGNRFASLIEKVVDEVRELGPAEKFVKRKRLKLSCLLMYLGVCRGILREKR